MSEHMPPQFEQSKFHCPHCGVYAHQHWNKQIIGLDQPADYRRHFPGLSSAHCEHCHSFSLWLNETLIHPDRHGVAVPNSDLPDEVKRDYEEAAAVLNRSPRAAAALLRLAIQKICDSLEPGKGDLNAKIGQLVAKGLRAEIQQALDIVRVIGNNAVHPGQLDLKDDVGTCAKLFGLINMIAEDRISQPRKIAAMFGELPADAKSQIEKRDKTR